MGAHAPRIVVGARYYDPATGRFLQRDPIGIEGAINVYEYVESAPTIWVDPEGLQVASPVPPYYAAGGAAAAREAAEVAAFLACAGYGAHKVYKRKRPRIGDHKDPNMPDFPTHRPPIRPPSPPNGGGHPASYPLLAMVVIFLAYAGTQVFHRRSLGNRGRAQT